MCGISGFFTIKPQPVGQLRAMNDLVRHRGPDDEGYVLFRELDSKPEILGGKETASGCYLSGLPYAPEHELAGTENMTFGMGHRRLSIIDLSVTGHQPMGTADGRYWMVYNGEIFNYRELREELKDLGYHFLSQSDSEVILSAWACWGEACLNRLNGMFAFALYDREKQTLFLVRDRFGVKPLYYWASPSGILAFASEIKQFTALPGWNPSLNGQLAYDYLIWGLVDHTEETCFKGIYQLRPGNIIRLDLQGFKKTFHPNEPLPAVSWYRLTPRTFEGSMEEAAAGFLDLFSDAVKLRLRSDVPVGTCLSGGLDSSSIVCLVNRFRREHASPAQQKSFSACSHDRQFDEREYIDEVVKSTGLDAHYVYPSLDHLFDSLEDIIWHQDEPFGSASIYAQRNVFGLAAQNGVKVMLDGQGADEYLAGYHTFFAVRQASLLRKLRLAGFLSDIRATGRLHNYTFLNSARNMASLILPAWQRKLVSYAFQGSELDPSWLDLRRMGARARNPLSLYGEKPGSVLELSLLQLSSSSLPMLLHWEDRNSMSFSIEARVPFLDFRVVEFCLGLPEEYKLKNGITKRVLREAMNGILPEKVRLRRDKIGFATPEQNWIKKQDPKLFRSELGKAIEISDGILMDSTIDILEEMISDKRPFSFLPWRLICFGKWLVRFHITV
jgi:asparagine synthase (glutamine-hydrolysing)